MQRALVAVDGTEQNKEMVKKAAAIAEGVGAELYLFSMLDPEQFDDEVETRNAIAEIENTTYSDVNSLESVHADLESLVDELFGDPAFEYETVVSVKDEDDHADGILEAAEKFDCEHVFLTGRKRSPTGKAIFGDTVQSVLLNFDGEVTVSLQ